MLNRRELFKLSGVAAIAALAPVSWTKAASRSKDPFRFCLNTSTISGQKPGLLKSIDIAAQAGYDGVELWVSDIKAYLSAGNDLPSLNGFIKKRGLAVEDAISFTPWMVNDDRKRSEGLHELEEEMRIMAALGCHRIAAPPAGVEQNEPVDYSNAADRYKVILAMGRKYGVMPLLEFWGNAGSLHNFGQAFEIAAAADDPDARILPDVFHLFRGGSGFNALSLVSGRVIDIIHMNDYPASIPAEELTDGDRVFPGDGIAPLKQVLRDLIVMGGTKVLSLELFNEHYWKQDALQVAVTGLQKMKKLVNDALEGP